MQVHSTWFGGYGYFGDDNNMLWNRSIKWYISYFNCPIRSLVTCLVKHQRQANAPPIVKCEKRSVAHIVADHSTQIHIHMHMKSKKKERDAANCKFCHAFNTNHNYCFNQVACVCMCVQFMVWNHRTVTKTVHSKYAFFLFSTSHLSHFFFRSCIL